MNLENMTKIYARGDSRIQLLATLKIRSLFATDVPPNFLTINIVLLPP